MMMTPDPTFTLAAVGGIIAGLFVLTAIAACHKPPRPRMPATPAKPPVQLRPPPLPDLPVHWDDTTQRQLAARARAREARR